jgi:hypothetical protein
MKKDFLTILILFFVCYQVYGQDLGFSGTVLLYRGGGCFLSQSGQ